MQRLAMTREKKTSRPGRLIEIPKELDPKLIPVAEETARLHENVLWSAQGQGPERGRAANEAFVIPFRLLLRLDVQKMAATARVA
jgi:hypothetical protein